MVKIHQTKKLFSTKKTMVPLSAELYDELLKEYYKQLEI